MARKQKEVTSWKFKLVTLLLSAAAIAGLFGFSFSVAGNEVRAIFSAAVPAVAGLLAAFALGKINRLSDNRWQIYIVVFLGVAAFMLLRIYRIF